MGLLALQADAYKPISPYPLDILDAQSQGMLGYLIGQAIQNELPEQEMAVILSRIKVDANDCSIKRSSKPIGPFYTPTEHQSLQKKHPDWIFMAEKKIFRRVVPSPRPLEILELSSIKLLIEAGILLICAGGGGIPVIQANNKNWLGLEGVIDKDLTAALLATRIDADILLILTDVEAVYLGWGTEHSKPIKQCNPNEFNFKEFQAGSMRPKIEAACQFAAKPGKKSFIGSLRQADKILTGEVGTLIQAN
ncbi:MAG: carbamate kinase [Francisellaceae bacterium]|nr:carbamate kinase [Francisellaceae bacterium]